MLNNIVFDYKIKLEINCYLNTPYTLHTIHPINNNIIKLFIYINEMLRVNFIHIYIYMDSKTPFDKCKVDFYFCIYSILNVINSK